MKRIVSALASLALLVTACSDDSGTEGGGETTTSPVETQVDDPTTTESPATTLPAPTPEVQARLDELAAGAERPVCDPLGAEGDTDGSGTCYLPFPSDFFTTEDSATDTGRRVALPSVLANVDGIALELDEWNRNDGFSPNTPLLIQLPGLDAEASSLPTWDDIGASLADDAAVVLVDTATGERIPLWAELDAHADDDADRLLTIRPAISLPEGHTFAVGLRGLVDGSGDTIAADPDFVIYRDSHSTTSRLVRDPPAGHG